MNDKEIKERLALIGAFAEDAQAGFEAMLVPFLLYGIAVPLGTLATFYFVHSGLAKFVWLIWLALIGFCQIFLPLYFSRKYSEQIIRASDRIFAVLWGGIGFIVALIFVLSFFNKIAFSAVFFFIGVLVALGCVVSGTLIQKKVRRIMYAESVCWLLCALFCLFVKPYTAPLIISGASFVLFAIPAFASLLIMRKKKNGNERR